jgi:hypothetical protein
MSRDTLHDLVDRIPEEELPAAKRFLEYLAVSPAYRAAFRALREIAIRILQPLTEYGDSGAGDVKRLAANGKATFEFESGLSCHLYDRAG